jgi:hypothetical protein
LSIFFCGLIVFKLEETRPGSFAKSWGFCNCGLLKGTAVTPLRKRGLKREEACCEKAATIDFLGDGAG